MLGAAATGSTQLVPKQRRRARSASGTEGCVGHGVRALSGWPAPAHSGLARDFLFRPGHQTVRDPGQRARALPFCLDNISRPEGEGKKKKKGELTKGKRGNNNPVGEIQANLALYATKNTILTFFHAIYMYFKETTQTI